MVTTIKVIEIIPISSIGEKWFKDNQIIKVEGLCYHETEDDFFAISDFFYENAMPNRWNNYVYGRSNFAMKEI